MRFFKWQDEHNINNVKCMDQSHQNFQQSDFYPKSSKFSYFYTCNVEITAIFPVLTFSLIFIFPKDTCGWWNQNWEHRFQECIVGYKRYAKLNYLHIIIINENGFMINICDWACENRACGFLKLDYFSNFWLS